MIAKIIGFVIGIAAFYGLLEGCAYCWRKWFKPKKVTEVEIPKSVQLAENWLQWAKAKELRLTEQLKQLRLHPEVTLADEVAGLLMRFPGLILVQRVQTPSSIIEKQIGYDHETGEIAVDAFEEEPTSSYEDFQEVHSRYPLAAPDSIEWLGRKLEEIKFGEGES